MNVEQLTKHAEDFLRERYEMELGVPVVINNRLRTTMGAFMRINGEPNCIEIAGCVIKYGADEAILDLLRHELIHYALYMKGEPYSDGHPHFERELEKHGVKSTGTNCIGVYYYATCTKCGAGVFSKNKSLIDSLKLYSSRCCEADIDPVGERIFDGTEAI